ncbi:MAG TPA: VWA domain-containing protein [Propionicimonas sp.]|nr:VWA domain-containing protein [Propionicimonas sp.]HRA05424.1 VWA domain-containing protein [Propionicimonas sp.]
MTNPELTHIEFVLDRSGSMQSIRSDIEGGFAAFIADQSTHPGRCTVGLARFDDQYEVVFTGLDVHAVPPLDLQPRGSTAMLDAIGRSINALGARLAALAEGERPGTVIVAIMTDGMENASKEFTHAMVNDLITRQERDYNWQFLYMGADQDAVEVGASIGVRADRSLSYGRGKSREAYSASSKLAHKLRDASRLGAPMAGVAFDAEDRSSTED